MSQPKEVGVSTPSLPSEAEVQAVLDELDGFDKYAMAEVIVGLRKAASSETQPLVDGDLATQRAIHDQNIADAYAEGYGDGYEAGASAEEACRDER